MDLKPHPLSELFPLHEGEPLWDLAKDMHEHGQREEVVLLDGMILDGRRRMLAHYRNLKAHGEVPDLKTRKFGSRKTDGDDPLRYVVSINLKRRHLGEAERKIVAAKIANLAHGQKKTLNSQEKVEESPNGDSGITQYDAAKIMNVSKRGVERAAKVLKDGSEEIQKAVTEGSVSVSDAAAITDEPKPVQNEALKKVESGKAKTLKEAVKSKNGKPIYDDRKISDMIGKLVREIDERKNAVGKGKWHAEMIDAMEAVAVAWKRAQKERG